MNIVTLDFETYFDEEYTLKKLTTEAYIRDERFEVLGVGVRFGYEQGWYAKDESVWWYPEAIKDGMFDVIDWANTACLCHHSQFDGLILSHHFGIKPAFWLDTLSMARLVVGNHLSVSLDSLARHFGLAAKNVPYNLFKGKHWEELDAPTRKLVADGCLHDCSLTFSIFTELMKTFPVNQLPLIDLTIRCFTEPVLRGDVDLLGKIWTEEATRKRDMLVDLGITEEQLQSSDQFAELLRTEGVEPEMKDGKATAEGEPRQIYAFAKTDLFMKQLIEEDETTAGDLARARLGVKSTINQTRAETLGYMATRGPMCVYLAPFAAHTTRMAGGQKSNFQNFPRKGDLKKSIMAPEGHLLAIVDASQIEARLLDVLAGQEDMVEKWRQGIDIYSELATEFYNVPVSRADPDRRMFGKVLKLQAGYGSGGPKIRATARNGAIPVILTEAEGMQARDLYRGRHPRVVDYWGTAGRMLARIGGGEPMIWGPMEIKDGKVFLPDGTWLDFTTLEYDSEWASWRYKTRHGWQRIWGSALVAETTQALARVFFSEWLLRIRPYVRIVWLRHDEAVTVVKQDGHEQETLAWLIREMKKPPAWLPHLPLDAEGTLASRYEK